MTEEYPFRVEYKDLSAAALELKAEVGEGFEVLDIGIDGGEADLVEAVYVGEEVMLGLPADEGQENLVPVRGLDTNQNSLMKTLLAAFPDLPLLKVPEGKTLKLPKVTTAGKAYVFYRKLLAEQAPKIGDAGAPAGYPRIFISHSSLLQAITLSATEVNEFDTNKNPEGQIGFPAVGDVPAGYRYGLLGMATSLGAGSGANITYTGIRLWKLEKAILMDSEGFVNPSVFPYNMDTTNKPFFCFPKIIWFEADEIAKFEAKNVNASGENQNAEVFLTTIWLVEKV